MAEQLELLALNMFTGIELMLKQSASLLDEKLSGVQTKMEAMGGQIAAVQTQVSGDAPPVTAGVRADLVRVHFELDRAIQKVRLTFWALVFVLCMQVAIMQ
jgi:hypothetical protein